MAAKKVHLSRRSIRWKCKTTNGDLCKYRIHELMGSGRKDGERTFIVQSLILTKEPERYTNNPVILRLFYNKALIFIEEAHTAMSWITIGAAVGQLMERKNNDK